MTNLEAIDLRNSTPDVINHLRNLDKFMHLGLCGNNLETISSIKFPPNIKALDLYNNKITDLSPLKSLTKLEYLDLHKNDIKEISPLKELTNLKILDLDDNIIQDVDEFINNKQYDCFTYTDKNGKHKHIGMLAAKELYYNKLMDDISK